MANLRENDFSSTATFFKPYSYTLHISVSFVLLLMNVLAKQPVDCYLEDLKCWQTLRHYQRKCCEAWYTTCRHKAKDITLWIAWRREAWKQEVLDNLLWKDERGSSSIRQTRTISKAMLGKLLRWGGACMGFFEHIDTILNWTDEWWSSGHSQKRDVL